VSYHQPIRVKVVRNARKYDPDETSLWKVALVALAIIGGIVGAVIHYSDGGNQLQSTCSEKAAEENQLRTVLKTLDHDLPGYKVNRARVVQLQKQLQFCTSEPPEEIP
jgi:hypothetical protein